MRQWIDLFERRLYITEVRKQDGVWKNPTARDLATLVADRDMRGVAVGNDVWLDYAFNTTHQELRSRLGLPEWGYVDSDALSNGFNFYVCAPAVANTFSTDDAEQDWEDSMGGRNDWVSVGDRKPNFALDGAFVYVDVYDNIAVANRAFARMVS